MISANVELVEDIDSEQIKAAFESIKKFVDLEKTSGLKSFEKVRDLPLHEVGPVIEYVITVS